MEKEGVKYGMMVVMDSNSSTSKKSKSKNYPFVVVYEKDTLILYDIFNCKYYSISSLLENLRLPTAKEREVALEILSTQASPSVLIENYSQLYTNYSIAAKAFASLNNS